MAAPAVTFLQPELLARLSAAFPEGEAWRDLETGATLTLADWHHRSNGLARGLAGLGVAHGDRVALLIDGEQPLEWLVSYMAIHKLGAVAVALSPRLGPGELEGILRHAAPSVLLCSDVPACSSTSAPTVVATRGGGTTQWVELMSPDESDLPPVLHADDVADIIYTSGTTGAPKGVIVPHGNLSSSDRVPDAWLGLGFVTSSPFSTTSGTLLVCGPMRGGLAGWFLPQFDPGRWIDVVARERPVAAFLVPAMVELIVASPRFGETDLSSLAVVTVGSAPIATSTLRRFGDVLRGTDVLCGYGMTEFGAVTAMPMDDRGEHLGSVGLPLPGVEIRILDADGAALPGGAVGQVAIRGTRGRRQHLDEGGGTPDAWVDGWLQSGDLGRLDADGYLWIVGRQKDIVIRGGHNIVPGEVEAVLFEHPAVVEAAVAGVPHDVLGEDVAAWVVLREPVSRDELRRFLLTRLADYKVPRRITVLDSLPRNESGKVLKTRLAADGTARSTR